MTLASYQSRVLLSLSLFLSLTTTLPPSPTSGALLLKLFLSGGLRLGLIYNLLQEDDKSNDKKEEKPKDKETPTPRRKESRESRDSKEKSEKKEKTDEKKEDRKSKDK